MALEYRWDKYTLQQSFEKVLLTQQKNHLLTESKEMHAFRKKNLLVVQIENFLK